MSGIRPGGASDDAYSDAGWNGSLMPPTQNAIRDLVEDYLIPLINGDLPVRTTKNVYNEVTAVATAVETTIVSYTVPVAKYIKLYFIDVSGDNVASFFVKKNGTVIRTRRSWWAQGTDNMIPFSLGPNDGIIFEAGDVVSLTVIHNRTGVGSFEAALIFAEYDV